MAIVDRMVIGNSEWYIELNQSSESRAWHAKLLYRPCNIHPVEGYRMSNDYVPAYRVLVSYKKGRTRQVALTALYNEINNRIFDHHFG